MRIAVILLFLILSLATNIHDAQAQSSQLNIDRKIELESFYISKKYAKNIAQQVNKLVKKHFFKENIIDKTWTKSYRANLGNIESSTNLKELTDSINICLKSLQTSHCKLLSINDETYHFLHSLFAQYKTKKEVYKGEKLFLGFVCGGLDYKTNQVRFVLDNSPASLAGIKIGDKILAVNGTKYFGYCNFITPKRKNYNLTVLRQSKILQLKLSPNFIDVYSGYDQSAKASTKIISYKGKKLGYFHLWTGGNKLHDTLNWALEEPLADTDGLILDLRDGYGANDLVDLDRFYRTKKNYPPMKSIPRDGKPNIYQCFYDKPVVAIINGGARSGKELITYSLKKSGRATVIGTKTSGSVVAGRLFKLDKLCSLYLAVCDVFIDDIRLEGNGVEPKIPVKFDLSKYLSGEDSQLSEAKEILSGKISESK